MSGQYSSLETVISEMYATFPRRMMLSPNSTHDIRMGFSLPEWSLDYPERRRLLALTAPRSTLDVRI